VTRPWRCPFPWGLCFSSSKEDQEKKYELLHRTWVVLSKFYPGWTLEEIKSLSPRERMNFINSVT
jgi:hypothetical protein